MISRILCKLAEINNQTTNQWPNVVKHNLRQLFLIFVYKYLFKKCWTHNQTNQSIQLSFPAIFLPIYLFVGDTTKPINQCNYLIRLFFFQFTCFLFGYFQIHLSFSHIHLKILLQFTSKQVFFKVTWKPITIERQISHVNSQIN